MRKGQDWDRTREKQAIRERVWRLLEAKGIARFPGARGRIPNFVGAEECARHLDNLDAWNTAQVIKINPDTPQRAIRHRGLQEGKALYMAVPRLRKLECFIELDPEKIGEKKTMGGLKHQGGHALWPTRNSDRDETCGLDRLRFGGGLP